MVDAAAPARTMQLAPWHWHETLDPEQAHRQQLLHIEKQISFTKWLKSKRKEERHRHALVATATAARREEAQRERIAKEKERKESKRRQSEDSKAWREAQRARAEADAKRQESMKEKLRYAKAKAEKVKHAYTCLMRSKPPSAPKRLTFKEWEARKQREESTSDKTVRRDSASVARPRFRPESTPQDSPDSYDKWLKQKRREDHMKAKTAREECVRQALDEKLLHSQTWQKKAVVCAYSQNECSASQRHHWRSVTLSLLS